MGATANFDPIKLGFNKGRVENQPKENWTTGEELSDFQLGAKPAPDRLDLPCYWRTERHVRFVVEFPMTATGKPQKFMMRKQMMSELKLA